MTTEREATQADMRRFWPDKTDTELAAAREAIQAVGGTMIVVSESDHDSAGDACPKHGWDACCGCADEAPRDPDDPGAYPGPDPDCDCYCHE